jgi:hypothetical protein
MPTTRFADQPPAVKFGLALTLGNSFVLFEELVIDRNGLDRLLPLYRVGELCTYDALALALTLLGVYWLPGRRRQA